MEAKIIVRCYDCGHLNRQYLGTKGYVVRPTTFESFRDAHAHAHEYPEHDMTFEIEITEGG